MTKGYKRMDLDKATKEQILATERAIRALRKDEEFFDHLKSINYYPHSGQKQILQALLNPKIKRAMLQCSRSFGKSVVAAIDMVMHAGRYTNQKNYIIAPFRSQANEIYWASGFIQSLCPIHWLLEGEQGVNKSELRLKFKNGSFIKLDGADNVDALRGYKPTRLVCDEKQAWRQEAWQAMEPNLLPNDATCIDIYTPPDIENFVILDSYMVQRKMKEGNPRYFFLHKTIYDNPLIPVERIEELHEGFVERGEEAIWRREYLAEFVEGGAASIFPMFNRAEHVRPIEHIKAELASAKPEYVTVSDPSGTRHATILFAYNRAVSKLYVLEEIVETDANKLSCGQLKDRIREKELLHSPKEEPTRIYDEAASLFQIEMANLGMDYGPTHKRQNDKDNNISLFRDMLVRKKIVIAEHCKETIGDILRYHTNEKGKIVKELDDLVDCGLYCIAEIGYSFQSKPINVEKDSRRFYRPEEEIYKAPPGEDEFMPHHDTAVKEDSLWDLEEDIVWQ